MTNYFSEAITVHNITLGGSSKLDTYIFTLNNFGTYNITASSGINALDLSALTNSLIVNLTSSNNNEVNDNRGNTINWLKDTIATITLGSNNDSIIGNAQNNLIDGANGNDSIWAGEGNDSLIGGAGNDFLDGGTGNDLYIFTAGFGLDTISDSAGNDTIDLSSFSTPLIINLLSSSEDEINDGINTINWANSIIENITTGAGNDIIKGNNDNNVLIAGAGNDLLNGGFGNDSLSSEVGDDNYIFSNNWGQDSIIDSDGNDTIDLSAITNNLSINLNINSSSNQVRITDGINSIKWQNGSIENLFSGSGHDTIIGSTGSNIILSGDGNDTINAEAGNDIINAGAGDDLINGGIGNDILMGDIGSDIFQFNNNFGIDIIKDDAVYDTNSLNLSGVSSKLNINLNWNANENEVSNGVNNINWEGNIIKNVIAGTNDDWVGGNSWNNILDGNDGNDILGNFIGKFGQDTIIDSAGNDTLNLSQYSKASNAILSQQGDDLLINLSKFGIGDGSILIKNYYGGNYSINEIIYSDTTDFNNAPTLKLPDPLRLPYPLPTAPEPILYPLPIAPNPIPTSPDPVPINTTANPFIIQGTNNNDIFNSSNYDINSQKFLGKNGNDTYIFNGNFGHDIIQDVSGNESLDLTAFNLNIASDPFSRIQTGPSKDDLVIDLGDHGSITINNYFNSACTGAGNGDIESIDFGNQHGITLETLQANHWI